MFSSIWDDIKAQFQSGNIVVRLIITNVAIFVGINIVRFILFFGGGMTDSSLYTTIVKGLSISSDPLKILTRPWTIFTHMFLHEEVFHLLWNMLFLYWFGQIVEDLLGRRRVLPLYVLGGLMGALFFVLSVNFLPYGGGVVHTALGASAAVMAVTVASAVSAPEYRINLLLLGPVPLKYFVLAVVFMDLMGTAGNINTGGHFAHLGGAFMGWFFVTQLQKGRDYGVPVNKAFDWISDKISGSRSTTSNRKAPQVIYRNEEKIAKVRRSKSRPTNSASHQERVDAILDKIKQKGYGALSDEEKAFLTAASKK